MDKPTWNEIELARLHKQLEDTSVFLSLLTNNYKKDPRCLIELGFAMMLEKPIIIVAPTGTKIPRAILKIADVVEFFNGPEDLRLATQRALEKIKELLDG